MQWRRAKGCEPNVRRCEATAWQASQSNAIIANMSSDVGFRFYYVYVLVSEVNSEKRYTGVTRDLRKRLQKHNRGECPHPSKHLPWKIETAIAFESESKARALEEYLKTGSGRELARPHF